MLIEFLLCAIGLSLLAVAADHLVCGASRLAGRLRIDPVVVGVVVIGLGTSAPEFLVSGTAAARGETDLAVGNIIGSNILNLTLILGVAATITTVRVAASVIRREVPLTVAAGVALALAAIAGLRPVTAGVLSLLLIAALARLIVWSRNGRNRALAGEATMFITANSHTEQRVVVETVRLVLGLGGVLLGAQLLVTNASSIATHFGVPRFIIGFTLVALGTSLPELSTTIQAQRRGGTDLVIGNLFGSNLFNSLAGGAVIGFARGAGDPAYASPIALLVMLSVTLLAWALLSRGQRLGRGEGIVLLGAYLLTLPLLLSP